jgi:hypothetical protein
MNMGQPTRMANVTLPKLKPGERLWEGGESFIYMKENGDIVLFTLSSGQLLLGNLSRMFSVNVGNVDIKTDAGELFFGQLKRMVPDPISGGQVQKVITDLTTRELNELKLNVYEYAPSVTDVIAPPTPLLSIQMGTLVGPAEPAIVVDPTSGFPLNKLNLPTPIPTKQVMCRITLKSGVQINIDKAGRVTLTGVVMNINNGSVDSTDPDVALALEGNNPVLGTRGQHIAREHDAVTIPLSATYKDAAHATQQVKAAANVIALQKLAAAFVSPAGPCTLNVAALPATLQGEITEGASDLYAGGVNI